ncbi:MAG: thioredoxin family protein [Verrucomicrobiota bacterium]
MTSRLFCIIFFVVFAAHLSFSAPEIGKPAPDFSLPDAQGRLRSLKDYSGEWIVLEWTNYDCPFVKKFYESGEMQKLQKECEDKGVEWISICSSAVGKQGYFTTAELQDRIEEHDVSISAYLVDEKGVVGRLYDAKTTPQMFVINPEGMLIYTGAIDSIPSTDQKDIPKAMNFVRAALENAMAGNPVLHSETKPYGCSVKY